MHSTLKQSTLRRPKPMRAASKRPLTPSSRNTTKSVHTKPLRTRRPPVDTSVARAMPRRLPELVYDDDTSVRRISQQGSLKWKNERTFVSEIFAYEWLGLRALDERYSRFCTDRYARFSRYLRHTFHRKLSAGLDGDWGSVRPSKKACGNAGVESLENQKQVFHPSTVLGNRAAIPTFPHARRSLLSFRKLPKTPSQNCHPCLFGLNLSPMSPSGQPLYHQPTIDLKTKKNTHNRTATRRSGTVLPNSTTSLTPPAQTPAPETSPCPSPSLALH